MKIRRFAVKTKVARLNRQLTKKKAAALCGVPLRAYESFEDGQHEPMSEVLLKISRGLTVFFTAEDITATVDSQLCDQMFDRASD